MEVSMIDLLTTGKLPIDDEFPKTIIHLTLKQHGRQATAAKALHLAKSLNPNKTLPMKIQEQLKDFFRDISDLRSKRQNDIQARNVGFKGPPITARMLGLKVYRSATQALRRSGNHALATIGVTVREPTHAYARTGTIGIELVEIHTPIKHYHFNIDILGKPNMVGDRLELYYYEREGHIDAYHNSRLKYQRNGFYVGRLVTGLKWNYQKMYTSNVTRPPHKVLYQHGMPMPKRYGTTPLNVLGA